LGPLVRTQSTYSRGEAGKIGLADLPT